MDSLYSVVILICDKLQVVSDLFWEFPTNFDWYKQIPVIGNFSLAIVLLVATGIFFTFKFGFVQFKFFGRGIKALVASTTKERGISPLAAFLLSSAMRVGPGNILGVTGAISIGGPGALFWMWISALFAMATSFVESTLSQIFKEKDGKDFIGGMPYYGRRLCKGAVWVGIALSCLYIVYAFLCLPAQGFNTISGINMIGSTIIGETIPTDSMFNYIVFVLMLIFIVVLTFGGIKKIVKFTDKAVPIMAIVYLITTLILIIMHFDLIPWFFKTVVCEAFVPNAIFGGAFGVALSQGIKRGLMSNEAGQGTISMPAAASNAKHPCEQGCVQSIGVFFDTIVICTPTAFVVILSQMWLKPGAEEWFAQGKLEKFVSCCGEMVGNVSTASSVVTIIVSLCFGLFALTTLVGFLSFTEMCSKRIANNKIFINVIRVLCLCVITFGVLANFAGLDLSQLWNLSDLANIMMVYINVPLLYIGLKYVTKAYKHYNANIKFYDSLDERASFKKKISKLDNKLSKENLTEENISKLKDKKKAYKQRIDKAEEYIENNKNSDWQFNSKTVGVDIKTWDNYWKK